MHIVPTMKIDGLSEWEMTMMVKQDTTNQLGKIMRCHRILTIKSLIRQNTKSI